MPSKAPRVFISYSYDSDAHKEWVKEFATRLRSKGVDVTLDKWHAVLGDQLPEFMERAIRDNDFVLIICTPKYKERSDGRVGGVGYEGDIITGELAQSKSFADPADRTRVNRKFIPVLRSGSRQNSSPSWLAGKYGVDLSADPYSEEQFMDLLRTLHGRRLEAPPLGPNPFEPDDMPAVPQEAVPAVGNAPADENRSIRILNIVVDEVTTPRNDGSRGSALYAIPLQLSCDPSSEWSAIFEQVWNHPPEYTGMHRPGIARVEGDRIILDGTTPDEFEKYHRNTLKLVMKETNRRFEEHDRSRRMTEERRQKQEEDHRRRLGDDAARMNDFSDFDD